MEMNLIARSQGLNLSTIKVEDTYMGMYLQGHKLSQVQQQDNIKEMKALPTFQVAAHPCIQMLLPLCNPTKELYRFASLPGSIM